MLYSSIGNRCQFLRTLGKTRAWSQVTARFSHPHLCRLVHRLAVMGKKDHSSIVSLAGPDRRSCAAVGPYIPVVWLLGTDMEPPPCPAKQFLTPHTQFDRTVRRSPPALTDIETLYSGFKLIDMDRARASHSLVVEQ